MSTAGFPRDEDEVDPWAPRPNHIEMIRITISIEAFEAIAQTMPLGTVAYETEGGDRHIWLDPLVLNRFRALGGPGESYSDIILRIAANADTPST